jgi:hypothetical protein
MSHPLTLEPYVDGHIDPVMGNRLTIAPTPRFPFKSNPIFADTYSREYDWDFDVIPGSLSRMSVRTPWTNLLTYSEDFENAAWTKTNLSAALTVGATALAPDGRATLVRLMETTTSAEHSVTQAVTMEASAYEVSIFAKARITRSWIRLAFIDSAATTFSAFFNVSRGYVITPSVGVTTRLINLGNGDYRCVIRFTPAAGAGTFKVNISTDGSTISYAGTTTFGMYLWGAQVTLGTDTPYVYTASIGRAILAPDRDPLDPLAFQIAESDPEPIDSHRERVRRTYARIPLQQIIPGYRYITKPDLPGEFPQVSGNSLIIQPEENVPRWVFYTNKAVTSDSGVPNGDNPAGGTYTVTIGASTTAGIAYNASAATLQTALNGLSSVSSRGSVTVTGSYTAGFVIKFNAYTAIAVNTSSLTGPAGYTGASVSSVTVNVIDHNVTITALGSPASFSGGTFILTIFGQTTAPIAYNASEADLLAAITALSNVGSVGVLAQNQGPAGFSGDSILSDSAFKIAFYIQVQPPAISASGASLTPAGSSATTAAMPLPALYSTRLTFTGINLGLRILYSAAHGISALSGIVVTQGENYRTIAAGLYSVSTDTIILTALSGVAFTTPTIITFVGSATGNAYTGGSKLTRVKRVSDFYLLGVSYGVNYIDDVPLPVSEGGDASLLAAIFAGDTEINYEVEELGPYYNQLERVRTTLNAATL